MVFAVSNKIAPGVCEATFVFLGKRKELHRSNKVVVVVDDGSTKCVTSEIEFCSVCDKILATNGLSWTFSVLNQDHVSAKCC